MNLEEVERLITSVAESGTSELKLDFDSAKIKIKTSKINAASRVVVTVPSVEMSNFNDKKNTGLAKEIELNKTLEEANDFNKIVVKSPFIGTFSLEPFVQKFKTLEVGDFVKQGDFLCFIEALKLKNQVHSSISGSIKEILVKDQTPVEFDQPLFIISSQNLKS